MKIEPETADKIVAAIIKDITDRRGMRQAWEYVDRALQQEIRDTWRELVIKAAGGENGENPR